MDNKKPFLSILLILLCAGFVSAQVKGIKNMIRYNPKKFHYDCFIIVTEGRAESIIQRGQFNSSYSIVVDGFANALISERNMPLMDNQNYQGNTPSNWTISSVYKNTATNQMFLSILPSISPSCFYNNIQAGDTVLLFCIKFDKNFCGNEVKPYQNDKDYGIGNIPFDFSNGFSIGGLENVYKGNLDVPNNNKAIDFNIEQFNLCKGGTVTLPNLPNIMYTSSDHNIAEINNKAITTKRKGNFTITAIDEAKGCYSHSNTIFVHDPEKPVLQKTEIMIGEEMALVPNQNVTWTSSNPSVAIALNSGTLKGLNPGNANITYVDEYGCISPSALITVLNVSRTEDIELLSKITYHHNQVDISQIEGVKSATFYDLQGRAIQQISEDTKNINISNFTPGLYILNIKTSNQQVNFKLVKH
ncbi:MAG: hypothetical protein RLZZ546_2684 [Bacteroidota bacterium]